MIIKRKIPDKPKPALKEKIRRILFPKTPEDWNDDMAVIWRMVIISALVAAVVSSV